MVDRYRHLNPENVMAKGRMGESDQCRVFPLLDGAHSSSVANRIDAENAYQGSFGDEDPADLGLPNSRSFVSSNLEM
jgi:hypothetical protein